MKPLLNVASSLPRLACGTSIEPRGIGTEGSRRPGLSVMRRALGVDPGQPRHHARVFGLVAQGLISTGALAPSPGRVARQIALAGQRRVDQRCNPAGTFAGGAPPGCQPSRPVGTP